MNTGPLVEQRKRSKVHRDYRGSVWPKTAAPG